MARCEDFPACGHYDESTGPGGGSWCPDERGRFPAINLPTCKYCGYYLDLTGEDPHDCGGGYDEYDEDNEYDDEFEDEEFITATQLTTHNNQA